MTPDVMPRYVTAHLDRLRTMQQAGKPTAKGTRLRHSSAGSCSRALAFEALGVPTTNAWEDASLWVADLGTAAHETIQQSWVERYGDEIACETKQGWDDLDLSGHNDADHLDRTIEIKTMGASGFDIAVGVWRDFRSPKLKEPAGPKVSHRIQGALNAVAAGSDELVLVYFCTDPIHRKVAERLGLEDWQRFGAEWTFYRDEFEPWAHIERERMRRVLAQVDAGIIPPCEYPTSPEQETLKPLAPVLGADKFPCGWCNWRTLCQSLPAKPRVEDLA